MLYAWAGFCGHQQVESRVSHRVCNDTSQVTLYKCAVVAHVLSEAFLPNLASSELLTCTFFAKHCRLRSIHDTLPCNADIPEQTSAEA